jgi:hypothetical protein
MYYEFKIALELSHELIFCMLALISAINNQQHAARSLAGRGRLAGIALIASSAISEPSAWCNCADSALPAPAQRSDSELSASR